MVDDFLLHAAACIPRALHAAGIREVLIHLAAKEVEGRVVMLALPGEPNLRARSEFSLINELLVELPTSDSQATKGIR